LRNLTWNLNQIISKILGCPSRIILNVRRLDEHKTYNWIFRCIGIWKELVVASCRLSCYIKFLKVPEPITASLFSYAKMVCANYSVLTIFLLSSLITCTCSEVLYSNIWHFHCKLNFALLFILYKRRVQPLRAHIYTAKLTIII